MKKLTNKVKSFSNLTINKPDRFCNQWHGDFGYSFDGKFFTFETIFGKSEVDVKTKVEQYLQVEFKPEQIELK